MSTKTSTAQPPGRRTPLSLNSGTKQLNKSTNEKNDSSKKESNTNNQKTENSKKDFQPEKKVPAEKKQQSSTESRKPSSESKKIEEVKITKHEENKKNQNGGVNSNGVKDKEKQNGNESTGKPKPASSSSSGSTPKKESPKTIEKKKETAAVVVVAMETKQEDNKSKIDEKTKETTNDIIIKKVDDKKKDKERKEEDAVEKKNIEAKPLISKSPENLKAGDTSGKKTQEVEVIDLDSSDDNAKCAPHTKDQKKTEELLTFKTPVKEKKIQNEEKQAQLQVEQLEDIEMLEPLTFEAEPLISAASTPAKTYSPTDVFNRVEESPKTSPKSEVKPLRPSSVAPHTPDRKSCPRVLSSISGRRTIRPIGDYAFSGNSHFRESYRKINTELDYTTSSLNVTVGSEVPNNDSFSFFSRSRKRDRSSPTRQSTMELQAESPKSPKRARIEIGMSGFFNAMASPITMLRARFSRATVQSTPKKQVQVLAEDDIVENVSGISVEEEITTTEDLTVNPDSTLGNAATDKSLSKCEEPATCPQKPAADVDKCDIEIKETPCSNDAQGKKKCTIM